MSGAVADVDKKLGQDDGRRSAWPLAEPSNWKHPGTAALGGLLKQKEAVASDPPVFNSVMQSSSDYMQFKGSPRKPAFSGSHDAIHGSRSDLTNFLATDGASGASHKFLIGRRNSPTEPLSEHKSSVARNKYYAALDSFENLCLGNPDKSRK